MPRAASEMNLGRGNREQERKARTPDPSAAAKEDKKKRGKSPFKLVCYPNRNYHLLLIYHVLQVVDVKSSIGH